jgi:3,4-dihydroxy 2-butanone 4-phosphate synthase
MFTGIVSACLPFYVARKKEALYLFLQKEETLGSCKVGDSVAVNGVCLTVAREEFGKLAFFVQQETLARTTFQHTIANAYANIELPCTMHQACHGHVVLGHVHGTGEILRIDDNSDGSKEVYVKVLGSSCQVKDSIALNGISLTVSETPEPGVIRVSLIPLTIEKTTWKYAQPGNHVNVEFSNSATYEISDVPSIVEDIRRGRMVIVMDNEDRENEGDLIVAAAYCTAEHMRMMIRHTSGILCAPMTQTRADELKLPPMMQPKGDRGREDPRGTAFTVSCDSHETSTGVSAEDRMKTFRALANPDTICNDLQRPGHIFPLTARDGLLATREGHTEASVTLMKLAQVDPPVAAIGELTNDDGTMMRLWDVIRFAKERHIRITTIETLKAYLGIGIPTVAPQNVVLLSSTAITLPSPDSDSWTLNVVYCAKPVVFKICPFGHMLFEQIRRKSILE